MTEFPRLMHTALDTTDARGLADFFYCELLGLHCRPGDKRPAAGPDDADWIVLLDRTTCDGSPCSSRRAGALDVADPRGADAAPRGLRGPDPGRARTPPRPGPRARRDRAPRPHRRRRWSHSSCSATRPVIPSAFSSPTRGPRPSAARRSVGGRRRARGRRRDDHLRRTTQHRTARHRRAERRRGRRVRPRRRHRQHRDLVDKARAEDVPVVWVQHSDDKMPAGSDAWQYVPELTPRRVRAAGAQALRRLLRGHRPGGGARRARRRPARRHRRPDRRVHPLDAPRRLRPRLRRDARRRRPHDRGPAPWGAPAPEQVIAHTNLYWSGPRRPAARATS